MLLPIISAQQIFTGTKQFVAYDENLACLRAPNKTGRDGGDRGFGRVIERESCGRGKDFGVSSGPRFRELEDVHVVVDRRVSAGRV